MAPWLGTLSPYQFMLAGFAKPSPKEVLALLAAKPMRSEKAQAACDHGLFSDDAAQMDLVSEAGKDKA